MNVYLCLRRLKIEKAEDSVQREKNKKWETVIGMRTCGKEKAKSVSRNTLNIN